MAQGCSATLSPFTELHGAHLPLLRLLPSERLSSLIFYMALAAHSSYSFGGLIQMKLPFEPIPPLYVKVSSMLINGSFLIFTPPSFHSCIHGLEDLDTSDLLAKLPENQPMAMLTDLKRRFTGLPGRHWADLLILGLTVTMSQSHLHSRLPRFISAL